MARSDQRVVTTAMWRRCDAPGHDVCHLLRLDAGWALEGCAIFREGGLPCLLHYRITCNRTFETREARIHGWRGRRLLEFTMVRDATNAWTLNGRACRAVQGCVDVDINFSPATNLLSLRRLRPKIGQLLPARVAWLDFPHTRLSPLEQTYRRLSAGRYDYRAPALRFKSTLRVDRHGMVLDYPPLWTQERGGA